MIIRQIRAVGVLILLAFLLTVAALADSALAQVRPGIGASEVASIRPPAPGKKFSYVLVDSRIDTKFQLVLVRRSGSEKSPKYDAMLQTKVSAAGSDGFERFVKQELGATDVRRKGRVFAFPGSAVTDSAFRATLSSIGFGPAIKFRPHDCSVVIGTCQYKTSARGQKSQNWFVQTTEKRGVWTSLTWLGRSAAGRKPDIKRVFSIDANGITIDEVTDYFDGGGSFRVTIRRK